MVVEAHVHVHVVRPEAHQNVSFCSSEHNHDTLTAQCLQWCKPPGPHCARARAPLRAHACAHTRQPGVARLLVQVQKLRQL
eukprot:scaffold59885_cov75-Phaeocystis_antarctica.AAC.3